MHIYTNCKCDIWESDRRLNFNFIPLPCPIVVTRMCQPTVCYAVHLWKMMPHAMFWLIQTFCEWKIHWTFPLLYIVASSFVWHVCPSDFACPLGHCQCGAFILERFVWGFFFFYNFLIQITVPCNQKCPILVHSWTFSLLIFTSCVHAATATFRVGSAEHIFCAAEKIPVFVFCFCSSFLHQLTQVTQSQHDPCINILF